MKKILFFFAISISLYQCKNKEDVAATPPVPFDSGIYVPPAQAFRLLDSTQLVNDLKTLSSPAFKGRKADLPEVALTRNLIIQRLREAGVDSFTTGFVQNFTHNNIARKNYFGYVKGTTNPNQFIVVGAHYDHLGVNASNVVFPGADDNASGVAATLAMAKYFQANKPKFSIIFALWDAEEVGLRGSAYFVNNLPSPLTLMSLRFNLNADMIARSDNNSIWGSGLSHYPAFRYLVDSIAPKTRTLLKSGYDKPSDPQDWTYLSDHGSFHQKNIPYLYLGVEDHIDYHKVSDSYDKINLDRFTENANIFLQMARLLDRKMQ